MRRYHENGGSIDGGQLLYNGPMGYSVELENQRLVALLGTRLYSHVVSSAQGLKPEFGRKFLCSFS